MASDDDDDDDDDDADSSAGFDKLRDWIGENYAYSLSILAIISIIWVSQVVDYTQKYVLEK